MIMPFVSSHWTGTKNGDPHYLVLHATSMSKFYLTVYVENIRGHLWQRYSIAVNQVMVATVSFPSDDLNLKENVMVLTS
jgi:hypothetical protein